jgi:hypothetical protein
MSDHQNNKHKLTPLKKKRKKKNILITAITIAKQQPDQIAL